MKSIQTKLTVIILAIFLVALSALGGLNYWKARSILIENLSEDMVHLASVSAGDVADWLATRQSEISVMGVAPVVTSGNKEAIAPFLSAVAKQNRVYDSIGFATPDGAFINSAGATGSVGDREYFKKAMQGEASVSDPIHSKSTGHLVVIAANPVKADGRVIGVLYGAIDIVSLAEKVLAAKVGQTGYAYVIQGDGLVIIHPNKDLAMKANFLKDSGTSPALKSMSERMTKGEAGVTTYEFQGIEKMSAFAPVNGGKWSVAVTGPVAEVTEAISALTTISLITILIVLLIAGLVIAWQARRIARPIQSIEAVAKRIAEGDISEVKLAIDSNDEIGRLGQSFEQMTANLRKLINTIMGATEQVAASSEELTANAEQSAQASGQVATSITDTAQGTERQANATDEAVTLVEQMSSEANQRALSAKQAVDITRKAVDLATAGNASVESAIAQMNQIELTVSESAKVVSELGERSKEIGHIVDAIANIAGQTNLLALNAAIEAARAGEHGRGFAVVAEEVRKLAEESKEAAKQIATLIGEIQGKTDVAVGAMINGTAEVKKGTEVVDKAGIAFRDIMVQVNEVSGIADGVAEGLSLLAANSKQVLTSVKEVNGISREISSQAQNISAATEEQSAAMQEIASSSQALANLAEELQVSVRQFRL